MLRTLLILRARKEGTLAAHVMHAVSHVTCSQIPHMQPATLNATHRWFALDVGSRCIHWMWAHISCWGQSGQPHVYSVLTSAPPPSPPRCPRALEL